MVRNRRRERSDRPRYELTSRTCCSGPQGQQIRLLHSLKSSMSLNRLEVQFLPEKLFVPVCGARALPVGSKRKTTTCWPNGLRSGRPKGKPFLQVGFLCIDDSLTGAPVNDPDAFFLRILSHSI